MLVFLKTSKSFTVPVKILQMAVFGPWLLGMKKTEDPEGLFMGIRFGPGVWSFVMTTWYRVMLYECCSRISAGLFSLLYSKPALLANPKSRVAVLGYTSGGVTRCQGWILDVASSSKQSRRKTNTSKNNKLVLYKKPIESRNYDYIDFGFSNTITTTPLQYAMLDPFRTVILPSFSVLWKPSLLGWSPGVKILNAKIRLERVDCRALLTGAQSTTLLAGDLFNSIRYICYKTGNSTLDTQPTPLNNLTEFLDLRDVLKVYTDKLVPLPTQAFDSANGYNVPQVRQDTFSINLGSTLEWYSSDPTGATGWDTRMYNFLITFVSDSSVSPHPTIEFRQRMYYSWK